MPDIQLAVWPEMPYRLREPLWAMYTEAFNPLRKLAAQRHVYFRDEWTDLMDDDRVDKIVATSPNGTPIGLAVVTNQLKSVPLIEPEFFAALEPKLYEQGRIWYTVFVCTRRKPVAPRNTFDLLIDKVAEPIRPVRGVCYMDYAKCNVERGLPGAANSLLALSYPEAEHAQVDAQTYWSYYPGGRPL